MPKYLIAAVITVLVYFIWTDPDSHSAYLDDLERCVTEVELPTGSYIGATAESCSISYDRWKSLRAASRKQGDK